MVVETKTQKELVKQKELRQNAFKSLSDKELKALYNNVKGQVKKQFNALRRIEKGKTGERYKMLAGMKSPALKAMEEKGLLPDKMPESFEDVQSQLLKATDFLTYETATAKNWLKYLKDTTTRTEKLIGKKLTIEQSRTFWEVVDKIRELQQSGFYTAMIKFNLGSGEVIENIAKTYNKNKSVDEMLKDWKDQFEDMSREQAKQREKADDLINAFFQ